MSTRPCQGGWCDVREHCAHYQASVRFRPADRLCSPGSTDQFRIVTPAPRAAEPVRRVITERR